LWRIASDFYKEDRRITRMTRREAATVNAHLGVHISRLLERAYLLSGRSRLPDSGVLLAAAED